MLVLGNGPCCAGVAQESTGAQLKGEATLATTNYEGFPHAQTMANFPPAAHDVFHFDDLLSPEEKDIRYQTRAFMVRKIHPTADLLVFQNSNSPQLLCGLLAVQGFCHVHHLAFSVCSLLVNTICIMT